MEEKKKFDQIGYINGYNKKTYREYRLRVRYDNKKVIDKLDSVPSINKYIVDLIEKDMKNGSK